MVRRDERDFVAREDFFLGYKGPALVDGRMPVRELAPALIALGDLFQTANQIVEPGSPGVNLEVRAFEGGSFEAALSVSTQDAIALLTSDPAIALSTLVTLISDPSHGVFAALKAIRGKFSRRTNADGTTTITTESGDVYNFPNTTINILENDVARSAAMAAMEPLRSEGVEEMRIERADQQPLLLTKEEAEEIVLNQPDLQQAEEPVIDQSLTLVVTPISLSFKDTNKWRLDIGEGKVISALIEDERYLGKIHRREVGFLEGDTMFARMRMRQWANKKTEWTVLEVLRHHHLGGKSIPLPFEEES